MSEYPRKTIPPRSAVHVDAVGSSTEGNQGVGGVRRHCPTCGARLVTTTSRGGIPRRTCPECQGGGNR
ncbi:TFIIB-type zinc ribbon-containing protein [Haloplanus rubicundus]|uniref:Uncharacterized protein n=1 Tax=Haloplanus rubicundus TaxID=1547898 RepID=A0A345EHG4_9EURY|nr:hypothetical protein DU484_18220 [Haloplanus rubicundus]